jgi:hypothetical protein
MSTPYGRPNAVVASVAMQVACIACRIPGSVQAFWGWRGIGQFDGLSQRPPRRDRLGVATVVTALTLKAELLPLSAHREELGPPIPFDCIPTIALSYAVAYSLCPVPVVLTSNPRAAFSALLMPFGEK